ncbi:MAPEG family protein [Hydrocarboniphaga daqingensis]|jgi:uncharacterized MAPEG superfamily protein|uniref:MAPEG family protein n=1 Tax=Hydrocarboniphaga daqingensis TaxID=490188 RepID=A0A1M5L5G6_9GAMM|nr:MAPEG family protein [Hydrocarboniphaga daqingensis]SHG60029.1 MAPEG family protein [Hydrocarboniphaga daqingensis]
MGAIHALLGFAGWTLLMVLLVFSYRGFRLLTGTPINAWPRGSRPANESAFAIRAGDAHANCVENLVVFGVIVLSAQVLGRLDAIAPFAVWVLYARIGQSVAHLIGTNQFLVLIRATFWAAQLALMLRMLWQLFA